MIFPLNFSSRDADPVITSENNRQHGRQHCQLTALKSFLLEVKQNTSYILIPPMNITRNKTSLPKQLCLNQLPETVRFSAPSPLLGVPMATPWAEVKGITDRFQPPPYFSLCQFRRMLLSNLWGTENCHWATQLHLLCLLHLKSLSYFPCVSWVSDLWHQTRKKRQERLSRVKVVVGGRC